MRHNNIDVSICIVSYNTRTYLKKCLSSIYRFTKGIHFEIIVVDNASHDRSAEMVEKEFPTVQLIKNTTNRWFSGANNQALRQVQSTYIFFLNPDTWLSDNAVKNLKIWLDHHTNVGACEPRQVGSDGHIAPTGSLQNRWWMDLVELTVLSRLFGSVGRNGFFPKPFAIRKFRQEEKDRRKNWKTEVLSGAALFAKTDAVKNAGGFDERLKLYYTDADLCRKLIRDGWAMWHVGQYSLQHALSVSTMRLSWKERSAIYANDARRYYSNRGEGTQGVGLYVALRVNALAVSAIDILSVIARSSSNLSDLGVEDL